LFEASDFGVNLCEKVLNCHSSQYKRVFKAGRLQADLKRARRYPCHD
jgi:hypothetical protein